MTERLPYIGLFPWPSPFSEGVEYQRVNPFRATMTVLKRGTRGTSRTCGHVVDDAYRCFLVFRRDWEALERAYGKLHTGDKITGLWAPTRKGPAYGIYLKQYMRSDKRLRAFPPYGMETLPKELWYAGDGPRT